MNRDERQGIWIFMCAIVLLIPLTYAEDFLESQMKLADEVISLDEHLRSLNEPVEQYRSVSKRSDCGAVCGLPPPLDLEANCTKRQWVPNYEEKNGCECLTEYKCCDAQCPMADLTSCWRNGKKGQQFGIMEIDCCGCNVTKCVQCPPTLTRSELCPKTGKLSKCYNYSNTETHENITGCFRATCEEKLSDAPADESCDPKCQKTTVKTTQCLFDYNKCEASKVISNCSLYLEKENIKLLKKPIKCFHNTPTKVDEVNGGYFEDSSSRLCKKCFKWNYSPKSCATKNSAAKLLSCHKHGSFQKDKKCFQKNISPDDCGCNSAQCVESSAPESDTFGKDDICPLNTLKISGVSICMKARDICKRCAPLKELTPPSCSYGEVVQTYDSIGCKIYACKLATIPEVQCTSNKYELNKNTNKLTCLKLIERELKFVGGTYDASATYNDNNYAPYAVKNAFVLNPVSGFGWLSKQNHIPVVIWYCFQEQHSPKKISFRPWYTDLSNANNKRPQKFEFVGRVKSGDPWKVICEGTGYAEYKSMTEERGCEISAPIDHGFQCLGVRITQGTTGYVGLKRIRMWGFY